MRCVDLFSGCGGFSKGFQNAGFEIVAAFENWQAAIDCYRLNFSHQVYKTDLNDWVSAVDIIFREGAEVIIGGPPCQDFSLAGKRIEGERAALTVSFAKIIRAIRPKFFVMENVQRIQGSQSYQAARKIFIESGYGLTERVVNACYCGVPQNRKRFFCIGGMGEKAGFLDEILSAHLTEFPTTVREYCGDRIGIEFYYRQPRTYARRGVYSIDEPAPTIRGNNRPIPPKYKRHESDPAGVEDGVRALTYQERAMIQTFNPDFKWLESATTNNLLIGNAVPVRLAEYVGKCLMTYIEGAGENHAIGFINWLKQEKGYGVNGANDTLSRVRRLKRLWHEDDLLHEKQQLLKKVEDIEIFDGFSKSVKSQLKRAQNLYNEYVSQL